MLNRLVGIDESGTYNNNYANKEMIIKQANEPVTRSDNDINGTGKALAELKTLAFYNTASNWNTAAWDISSITDYAKTWKLNSNSLPIFQWQQAALYANGSGTEQDPYLIHTAEELAYLATFVNSGGTTSGLYFALANDINLTD